MQSLDLCKVLFNLLIRLLIRKIWCFWWRSYQNFLPSNFTFWNIYIYIYIYFLLFFYFFKIYFLPSFHLKFQNIIANNFAGLSEFSGPVFFFFFWVTLQKESWPSVAARVFQSPFSRVFFLSSQEKRNDERNSCGVVLLMMMDFCGFESSLQNPFGWELPLGLQVIIWHFFLAILYRIFIYLRKLLLLLFFGNFKFDFSGFQQLEK